MGKKKPPQAPRPHRGRRRPAEPAPATTAVSQPLWLLGAGPGGAPCLGGLGEGRAQQVPEPSPGTERQGKYVSLQKYLSWVVPEISPLLFCS